MILHLLKMARPLNIVIAGFSVILAASLSPKFTLIIEILFAIVAASLITAAANIINDIFDLEIDKINKPDRVLPQNMISVKTAWKGYFIINIMALICAFFVNIPAFSIALISVFILFGYSYYFKNTILLGNIIVSFVSALTFIYGSLIFNDWLAGIIPAILAFLFHFGREILKDIQDIRGDVSQNVITFPVRFGVPRSILIINLVFGLLIALLILPYSLNFYSIQYVYVVLPGVALVLMAVSVIIWFKNDIYWLGKISLILKLDMFIGLAAIFIGVHHDFFFNN